VTTTAKETNIVKNYRCHVQLGPNRIWEGEGDDLNTLKEDVNRMLNGGANFVPAQTTAGGQGLHFIYHPSFEHGKMSLGWISPLEVPESMSARAAIERRLHLQRTAA
jgi:hypothetical protein